MKGLQWGMSVLKKNLSLECRSRLKKMIPGLRDRLEGALMSSLFDWQRTQAYSFGSYGNIYVNLKHREPEGIVDKSEYENLRNRISERLMELKDPVTGEKVVKKVYRREDLYKGPFLDRAPDLTAHWSDAGYHSVQRFGKKESTIFSNDLHFHLTDLLFSGCHRLNGIVALKGVGIEKGKKIEGAGIIDLAPTILYLMGLPVDPDMDGKVLQQAIVPDYLAQHPVRYEQGKETEDGRQRVEAGTYGEEESEKIAERLRGLGYIE